MFITYIHFLNAVIAILFSQWSLMVSLDASSISIGWIVSPMMWFGHVRDNRSCQTLSVNGACPLVICAVPTPVKTTPELSGPAFGVLPKTGDEELEDRGKPSWEQLRMICARSTLAWRRQDGMLWIDRHGVCSWMRLRPRDTLQRERSLVSPPSNSINGRVSTMWFIVCWWLQTQRSDMSRPHLCKQARALACVKKVQQCPCLARKVKARLLDSTVTYKMLIYHRDRHNIK